MYFGRFAPVAFNTENAINTPFVDDSQFSLIFLFFFMPYAVHLLYFSRRRMKIVFCGDERKKKPQRMSLILICGSSYVMKSMNVKSVQKRQTQR